MSAFVLLKALADYLEPRLAEFPLAVRGRDSLPPREGEPDPMRPCGVFVGSLPPTASEAVAAAPFVAVQAMGGQDSPDGLDVTDVALRVCVIGDTRESAENDLLNLVSQIRLWLMEAPGGVIGGKFRLLPKGETTSRLPWERPDEQVPPFLQAHIFSQWQSAAPAMRPNLNMVDYE